MLRTAIDNALYRQASIPTNIVGQEMSIHKCHQRSVDGQKPVVGEMSNTEPKLPDAM